MFTIDSSYCQWWTQLTKYLGSLTSNSLNHLSVSRLSLSLFHVFISFYLKTGVRLANNKVLSLWFCYILFLQNWMKKMTIVENKWHPSWKNTNILKFKCLMGKMKHAHVSGCIHTRFSFPVKAFGFLLFRGVSAEELNKNACHTFQIDICNIMKTMFIFLPHHMHTSLCVGLSYWMPVWWVEACGV